MGKVHAKMIFFKTEIVSAEDYLASRDWMIQTQKAGSFFSINFFLEVSELSMKSDDLTVAMQHNSASRFAVDSSFLVSLAIARPPSSSVAVLLANMQLF